MTIARIPKRNATDIQTEDAFIEGKRMTPGADKPANKVSIMLRIDPDLLEEVGREAKAAGLTRSAWIHSALTRAVRSKG